MKKTEAERRAFLKDLKPRLLEIAKRAADVSGLVTIEDIREAVRGDGTGPTAALHLCFEHAQTEGEHHKLWVIDQVVRALTGDFYDDWVSFYCYGEDGPNTYTWDIGIAP